MPKLRSGSFFPSLLERRRRGDRVLFTVMMEAYPHGASTHEVDDLVKALADDTGISRSEVSWVCVDLEGDQARHRVVGDFSNPAALLRLAGAVLVEAHDEWQVSERATSAKARSPSFNHPQRRRRWRNRP